MGVARDRWLDEGLQVLASEGAVGVRIDHIAARLGRSKGSFHHHFDGAGGFKKDLLARYERLSIEAIERAIDEAGAQGRSTREVLAGLTAQLVEPVGTGLYHPQLDVAVRAWATSDPDVHEVLARVDQARLSALERVWRPHVDGDGDARTAALLPYLIAVGASVMVPPVTHHELKGVYELLIPLLPD